MLSDHKVAAIHQYQDPILHTRVQTESVPNRRTKPERVWNEQR